MNKYTIEIKVINNPLKNESSVKKRLGKIFKSQLDCLYLYYNN